MQRGRISAKNTSWITADGTAGAINERALHRKPISPIFSQLYDGRMPRRGVKFSVPRHNYTVACNHAYSRARAVREDKRRATQRRDVNTIHDRAILFLSLFLLLSRRLRRVESSAKRTRVIVCLASTWRTIAYII